MLQSLKSGLRGRLAPSTVDKLRAAKGHLTGLYRTFTDPAPRLPEDRSFPDVAADAFRRGAQAFRDLPDGAERDAVLRALMKRVALDERYDRLLETRLVGSVLGEDLRPRLLAAALYARGDAVEAARLFAEVAASRPAPVDLLCLARCRSLGLREDREAVRVLERGLELFPRHVALTLALAGIHYRLEETARANERLDTVADGVRALVRGSDPNIHAQETEIAEAVRARLLIRPKGQLRDTYNEGAVEEYWQRLWYHMNTLGRFQHGWANLHSVHLDELGALLETTLPKVRTLINFGVFCAYPDVELARRFPDVTFLGVDREEKTKRLNEAAFEAPNVRFLAADIEDVVRERGRQGGTLLFHARTATLCYPELLRRVYRTCAEAGIEHIAAWENAALSRTTLRYHDLGSVPGGSIAYQSLSGFIHDYRQIFADSGYELVVARRTPSNRDLVDEPYALGDAHLFLVARRVR